MNTVLLGSSQVAVEVKVLKNLWEIGIWPVILLSYIGPDRAVLGVIK